MLNLVVKSVVGRATSARLSSILEACIILLSPGFLTSHHFLYLLKFVLSWASSVGAMTDEQRGLIPDWRTGYNAEELKCEPRLYGKYYLRVINLDIIDRLCDEILAGLDATNPPSKSDFKDNQHNVLLKDYQNEMDTQLETGELREEGGRNLKNSKPSEPVKTSESPPTKENKELNTAPNSPAIKKKKPLDNTKSPQKIRPTMGLSYAANALHLALTPRFHRAAKERSQSVSQTLQAKISRTIRLYKADS
ncbi:hypothetical protein NECAME_12963 [Necator americanus]|uniref:Uncharacterized protein n=1 Tax=Necator americanus TaxID=51031 RepID=W2SY45_NECAM|nr:hypothetical protein NECAME_12963 [Necator americanus]ETN74463.1 hypothetical protein NECAME_12963 [Necator americanus]